MENANKTISLFFYEDSVVLFWFCVWTLNKPLHLSFHTRTRTTNRNIEWFGCICRVKISIVDHSVLILSLFSDHLFNQLGRHGELVSDDLSRGTERIRSRFSMDKPFECHQCQKRYYLKKTLMRHLRLECNKEPQFQCPLCAKKFKQKSHLKTHILQVENPRRNQEEWRMKQ